VVGHEGRIFEARWSESPEAWGRDARWRVLKKGWDGRRVELDYGGELRN